MSRHHARNQGAPSEPDTAPPAAQADAGWEDGPPGLPFDDTPAAGSAKRRPAVAPERQAGMARVPSAPQFSRPGRASAQPPGRAARLRHPGDEPGAWLPVEAEEVLLVTAFEFLQGEVARIVAAAGGQLRVVAGVSEAAPYWDSAAAVLVGSDIRELPPRRRAPAVLVGLSGEGDSLWHLGAVLGAQRVAVLPGAAAWLAEYLSRSRSPEAGGLVLGVTGGCGGAGATTAGIWIAQAAAGIGARVLLVDADPWGGGLELALAAE